MRWPSPALAVAIVALIVALGGTAWGSTYLITSTKQIAPNVKRVLTGARGPRGYAGYDGATGVQGPTGPAGPVGPTGLASVVLVTSGRITVPVGGSASPVAQCPAGMVAIGTGFYAPIMTVGFVKSYGPFAAAIMFNDAGTPSEAAVEAVCGPATFSGSAAWADPDTFAGDVAIARREHEKAPAAFR